MSSIILQSAARFLFPFVLLFSAFLLLRGHDSPGGGFAGGLVAAGGFTLQAIAFGPAHARGILHVEPQFLMGTGIFVVTASGMIGLFRGDAFLQAVMWTEVELAPAFRIALATPLLFDAGVFMAVLGGSLLVIFSLMEESR